MKVLVVGSGVAAAGFLHHASRLNLKVEHLSSPSNAPTCSLNSTAVAALRGTQTGLSPLGDELVAGWHEANEFYQQGHAGVERAQHFTTVLHQEKNLRRFSHLPTVATPVPFKEVPKLCVQEDAWIIRPAEFFKKFKATERMIVSMSPLQDQWQVSFLGGQTAVYDHVVLATGYWLTWMKDLFPLPALRPVQGSYYQWSNIDFHHESFSLAIDDTNVVYHHAEKTLLLGSSSVKDQTGEFADLHDLSDRYSQVSSALSLTLPEKAAATIHSGIRSVTRDRAPFATSPQKGLHLIGGLYKNGWVMAWRLGRMTAERITY